VVINETWAIQFGLLSARAETVDWGTLLGPGSTLHVRICQLSALVGRGAPAPVTLQF
jgi:hypothetical protein